MKINIICIGNIKEKFYKDAVGEYTKRLSKFATLNIIELKEEKLRIENNEKEELRVKEEEGLKILDVLKKEKESYNILLDVDGKHLDSVELSKKILELKNNTSTYKVLNFIIGGSLGTSDKLKKEADFRLSFSKMTFPHQLMRVILTEQIYRAFKIMSNEIYHK